MNLYTLSRLKRGDFVQLTDLIEQKESPDYQAPEVAKVLSNDFVKKFISFETKSLVVRYKYNSLRKEFIIKR